MHSFVRKHPEYALTGGKGRKRLYLYEVGDEMSVAWARLSVEHRRHVALVDVEEALRASNLDA
jgi:hypothetical protein